MGFRSIYQSAWDRKSSLISVSVILVLLVLFAGCFGLSFSESTEQEQPPTIGLINSDNETTTFEIYIMQISSKLTLHGTAGAKNITNTLTIRRAEGYLFETGKSVNYISIEFPSSSRYQDTVELSPGETYEGKVDTLPEDSAVVVAVHQENEIIAVASASCNGNLRYFEVTGRYDDVSIAHNCRGK